MPSFLCCGTFIKDGTTKIGRDSIVDPLFDNGVDTFPCILIYISWTWSFWINVVYNVAKQTMYFKQFNPTSVITFLTIKNLKNFILDITN